MFIYEQEERDRETLNGERASRRGKLREFTREGGKLAGAAQRMWSPLGSLAQTFAMGMWRPLLAAPSAKKTPAENSCFLLGFPETHKWL